MAIIDKHSMWSSRERRWCPVRDNVCRLLGRYKPEVPAGGFLEESIT
jgi:hypothetical protein